MAEPDISGVGVPALPEGGVENSYKQAHSASETHGKFLSGNDI